MILATALLSLWGQVVQQWPDSPRQQQQQPILCGPLEPTLQPAIALTAAILSTAGPAATAAAAAASTAAAAGSSSSSLMDVETARMEALACVEATDSAVLAADVIVTSIMSCIGKLQGTREQQQRQLSPLVSQDLLLLVTIRFGYECAQLYHLTDGASSWVCDSSCSSSSTRRRPAQQQPQHVQVPPYHEQLLSCLGVMTSERLPAALQQRKTSLLHMVAMQLLQRLLADDLPLPLHQHQLKVPDAQVTLLLLCCVEAALLVPGPCENMPAQLLPNIKSCCLANGIEAAAVVLSAAADDYAGLPVDVAEQVTEQFAGPMLQLLAPAVRQLLQLAKGKQQQQRQQQKQQAEMENLLSAEDLERQAGLRFRTVQLWSQLVFWVAAAAGVPSVLTRQVNHLHRGMSL
jgi:hypothetical protein